MGKSLVIGAAGQIGTDLVTSLRNEHNKAVVASDIRDPGKEVPGDVPFEELDILDPNRLEAIIDRHGITEVFHLAAMLSATAEKLPMKGWHLNMEGLFNVLELGRRGKLEKIFWPSSIAVFGPNSPKKKTPQHTVMDPDTVYGISKLAGERWCAYYHEQYGVDVRSLRYPGLISYNTQPGGGTTDYAVEIFYGALSPESHYTSYLAPETRLPMMYMPDAIRATIRIMEMPPEQIRIRSSYNIAGVSFSPSEITEAIQKAISDFRVDYRPDERQRVAESWPESIDDAEARSDWGWAKHYDLDALVADMLDHLRSPVG